MTSHRNTEMSLLTFVKSSRGGEKAVYEGYIYTKEKEKNGKRYWRCELRSCNARMHSTGDVVVKLPTEHTVHAPSSERISAATVASEVRSKATECESTVKNIVQQAIGRVPVVVAPALSTTSALSQIVRRKRRAALEPEEDADDTGANLGNLSCKYTVSPIFHEQTRPTCCLY